ncbi:uncharacterized protein LOC144478024, partial [Augochlora pura]
MSPSVDEIILKEGDPLRLICSGNSNIFFAYPIHGVDVEETVYSHTSPLEINKYRDENGTYWYEFYRPNTISGDTEWYGCSYKAITYVSRNYSDTDVSWVYVYVESEDVHLVARKYLRKVEVAAGEDVIIPCRPTSPDAEVNITKFIRAEVFDCLKKIVASTSRSN